MATIILEYSLNITFKKIIFNVQLCLKEFLKRPSDHKIETVSLSKYNGAGL